MKKSKIFLLVSMLFSLLLCSACSCFDSSKDKEPEIKFSIYSSHSTLYMDEGYASIWFTEDSVFDVDQRYVKEIEYFIVDEDVCEAKLVNQGTSALFLSENRCKVKIQAKYKDVLSENVVEIFVDVRKEDVLEGIQNLFEERTSGLSVGETYSIGLYGSSGIELIGAEGIIELKEDGKLEIIGIGKGNITIKKYGEVLYDGEYKVSRNDAINKILDTLIEKNVIASKEDNITNDIFKYIEVFDISDCATSAVSILKYSPNIKYLDLSNHSVGSRLADTIATLTDLEELHLDNTHFSYVKKLKDLTKLEVLSLSDNYVRSIEDFVNFKDLKYLDISNNYFEDLSPISSFSNLETLKINDTKITDISSLNNLSKLTSLDVSNLDLTFDQIKEISSFNDFKELGLNGIKDVDLDVISNATQLEVLKMSNCNLSSKDLSNLNKLTNLEYLDISNNNFDDDSSLHLLDGDQMKKLSTLNISHNKFTKLPNLLSLKDSITVFDISHSYYLEDISELPLYWNINELIVDYCNKIDFGDTFELINNIISNSQYKKLSIVGSLISFDKNIYEYVTNHFSKLALRIAGDKYYKPSEEGYLKGHYTSLNDFASSLSKNINNQYVIEPNEGIRDIVLNLKDSEETIDEYYEFFVSSGINSITIYGRGSYNLKFSFVAESKLDLYVSDIYSNPKKEFLVAPSANLIAIYEGSGVQGGRGSVSYKNEEDFTYNFINGYSGVQVSELVLDAYGDASLSIIGGRGDRGYTGGTGDYKANDRHKRGSDAADAGAGVSCRTLVINSANITIKGGIGGEGGEGGAGIKGSIFTHNNLGGNGGQGGDGGAGVIYTLSIENPYNAVIEGGIPGSGGNPGQGCLNSQDGKEGEPGAKGQAILKVE